APPTRWQASVGVPAAQPLTLRFPPVRRRRGLRLDERRARYDTVWRGRDQEPLELHGLGLHALAQLDETLILASTSAGDLVLVDQHRAHERVLYERLTFSIAEKPESVPRQDTPACTRAPRARSAAAARSEPAATQYLLEPLLIELTPRQTQVLLP